VRPDRAAGFSFHRRGERRSIYGTDVCSLGSAEDPGRVPKNVHLWTINFTIAGITGEISRGGQEQVATFFQSDGVTLNTPTPVRFFETPIVALPETYNYIP
jgi:hypothetical protein